MAQFDSQTPPRVSSVDYNTIRNKVASLLGTGSATQGYGQTLQSTAVSAGQTITKAQWDALRYDLINIKVHQDGVTPSIVSVPTGQPIRYGAGHPNSNFDTIVEQAILNRFNIGGGQSVVSTKATRDYTSSWGASATAELTVTFSTADAARHFFNSGGNIRFTSTRTGGTASSQNNAWTNLLTSIGTQSFGAASPVLVNFYTLTNSYNDGVFYQLSSSTPYSANYYQLAAKCDIANNVSGGATVVYFRITWQDNYVDLGLPAPGDLVDGTLNLTVEEFKATGTLQPSGSFTIASPSYSLSVISAS